MIIYRIGDKMKLKCQCGYEIRQEHGHQENPKSGDKALFFRCGQCRKAFTIIKHYDGSEELKEGVHIISSK